MSWSPGSGFLASQRCNAAGPLTPFFDIDACFIEDAPTASTDVGTPVALTYPRNWRRTIVSTFVVVTAAALTALGAWRLARQEPPRAVARVLIGGGDSAVRDGAGGPP